MVVSENLPSGNSFVPIEVSEGDDSDDAEVRRQFIEKKSFWTRCFQGAAITSGILAIVAIVLSSSKSVVIVAGAIAIGVAGLVLYQQTLLEDTDTLRKEQNKIREKVNGLKVENSKLELAVEEIKDTIAKLNEKETELQSITEAQGSNVSSLVSLVKENHEILKQMREHVKAETFQRLCEIFDLGDTDRDSKISKTEANQLVFRLRGDGRVDVDEEALHNRIENAGGELSIRDLLRELLSAGTEKNGTNIFFNPP